MRSGLAVCSVVVLSACGTPQQQCIGGVTRDLQVVDGLIAEVQGNLARGYGFADTVVTTTEFVDCTRDATPANPHPRGISCFQDVPQTVQKPVAIDLAAEAVKLDGLQAKRAQLATAAGPAVADCQARFPE